jgi:hypothetical protein
MLLSEGVLKFSFWGGIAGTAVENLLLDPRYPAHRIGWGPSSR